MQVNISGDQLDVTEAMRGYVEEKFSRWSATSTASPMFR